MNEYKEKLIKQGFSEEDTSRFYKDILINQIHSSLNFVAGNYIHNVNEIEESELEDALITINFIFKIKTDYNGRTKS